MKNRKMMLILTCAAMVVSLAACQSPAGSKADPENGILSEAESDTESVGENVQIANPWVDCETLDEAANLAGFTMEAPENPDGYPAKLIQAVEEDTIQVFYLTAEENYENDILVRKGKGTEDISGDYNTYSEDTTVTVGDWQVEMKGDDGKVFVAIWNDGTYSYSISAPGMSQEEVTAIIEQTR